MDFSSASKPLRLRLLAGLFLLVLSASLLPGCGMDPFATHLPQPHHAITLASADQLLHGQALAGSYLVSFRADPILASRKFANFADEHRAHFLTLASRHLADPRVVDIQFLTTLDLGAVGFSGPSKLDFGPPPAVMRALELGKASLPASLARVDFATSDDAAALLQEWEGRGELWFAEPNYISRTSQDPAAADRIEELAKQYGELNRWWNAAIELPEAYAALAARDLAVPGTPSTDDMLSHSPIIAVLDSGIDYEHPALKHRMWVNTDVNAANCDDDRHGCNTTVSKRGKLGNGDVFPYDTTGPGQSCLGKDSNCSHGTHVAGIIAADGSARDYAGAPLLGVCPLCRIMAVRIVSKVGKESGILDSSIVAAFKYIALFKQQGSPAVRIINASFGKFVRSRSVGLLVRILKESRGTLLVGAAGNEDTLTMEYPAAFRDAIAVAAVNSRLLKVSFSNFGDWVDISAPGEGISSTVPGGRSDSKSGTSMAAPFVSGVAGLMLARYPNISFAELKKWLLEGADPKFYEKDFEGGSNYEWYYYPTPGSQVRQPLLGLGLLNAKSSLTKSASSGLPVYAPKDRVSERCGAIAKGDEVLPSPLLAALLLLVPLFVSALFAAPSRRRSHLGSVF